MDIHFVTFYNFSLSFEFVNWEEWDLVESVATPLHLDIWKFSMLLLRFHWTRCVTSLHCFSWRFYKITEDELLVLFSSLMFKNAHLKSLKPSFLWSKQQSCAALMSFAHPWGRLGESKGICSAVSGMNDYLNGFDVCFTPDCMVVVWKIVWWCILKQVQVLVLFSHACLAYCSLSFWLALFPIVSPSAYLIHTEATRYLLELLMKYIRLWNQAVTLTMKSL